MSDGRSCLPENLGIHILGPSQAAEAASLEKLCFATPWSPAMLCEELSNPDSIYIGAMYSERLLGYAGVKMVLDEGNITNICVHPDQRGRGIGNMLMLALIRGATARGLSFLTLEVRPSNSAAIALYSRHGFAEAGRRKAYYSDPREDALIMTLSFKKPAVTHP